MLPVYKLCNAYDVLYKYETGNDEGESNIDISPPETWGLEATGWTSTYEKITKRLIDDDIPTIPADSLKFHTFASACVPPKKWMETPFDRKNGGYTIYLSDSSKTRKDILLRIFKALLGDVFSFNVVNHVFEALGIKRDQEYLMKVSSHIAMDMYQVLISHWFLFSALVNGLPLFLSKKLRKKQFLLAIRQVIGGWKIWWELNWIQSRTGKTTL